MAVLYSQKNVLSNGTKPWCFNIPTNIIHLFNTLTQQTSWFVSLLFQVSCSFLQYYSTLILKLKTLSAFQYNLFQENPKPFFSFHFPYIPTLPSKSNKNSERIFNLATSNWSYWSSHNKILFLQHKHMMLLTLWLCMTTHLLILGTTTWNYVTEQ